MEKHDKCDDVNLLKEKIEKISNEIEIAMFGKKLYANMLCSCCSGTFGDVGTKYLNKYRSLSYNIKVT